MDEILKKKLETGLAPQELEEKRAQGLVNGDLNVKTKSYKKIVFDNLFTLFNLVNVILLVCIIIAGSWKNALFFLVVIWNFLIGCIQEIRAKQTIDKLSLLSAPKVHALRNGKLEEILAADAVLGEIMQLKTGHQICLDCVILEGECQVNESLITGESTPIFKKAGDHLLSGSFLISGTVMAEAEHIGEENYVNQITLGAKYFKKSGSVIMKSVNSIVRVVAIALIPMAGLLVWKNFFQISQPFSDSMVKTVAAVSAMIPGGLVLLVSIVLAVSVIRLSKHRTLVQDLYCVENLARVDVVCLDKTGTITEGTMNMENLVPLQKGADGKEEEALLRAFVTSMTDDNSTINAVRAYYDITLEEQSKNPAQHIIPFSSETKWSMVYTEGTGCTVMGAPEFVCPEQMASYQILLDSYTKRSKRVLVLAKSAGMPCDSEGNETKDGKRLPKELLPMALIIIGDKVRKDAKQTLEYFREQGVALKVISGDAPQTVSMVASEAGLVNADKWIDATTLNGYEDIEQAIEHYTVFGRVTPYQKLDIIKALKAHGHTVAMTGDGANDVLALKEADCSIAMQSGSDAAKNVSNLFLLDSNFASLPLVVAEGRKSINNLQRSASLYLTKTTYAFVLAIIFLFVAFPYPFANIQVTLLGACTIGIPSFFLALEPNKERIRKHFLYNVFLNALPTGVLTGAAVMAATLYCRYTLSGTDAQISTVAIFVALAVGFIMVFNLSGKLKPWKWGLLAFIIAIAVGAVLILPDMFDIVPLTSSQAWLVVIVSAIFLVIHTLIFRVILPQKDKRERERETAGK